jgi:integrase
MALEHAVKLRYIQYNPAEHVKIPKQIKKQIKYLDKDNLNKFISSIKSHRLYAAFYLAVTSGIRRGELLALRWSDISFSDATMNIQRTVNRIKVFDDDEPHYKLVEGSPKSDKSIRILPILPDILDALKKHKSRQKQEILKCDDYKYNNLVFCNTNGTPLNPRNFAKHFYNVLSRNDITKINFHALRHTYATVGLQNGIELKVMQELLGHSSLSVTADTYTHVVLDQKKTEINKLKNAF